MQRSKFQFHKIVADFAFTAQELGVDMRHFCIVNAVLAFEKIADCSITCLRSGDAGCLFLASVPGQKRSGAIYYFNSASRSFYWITVNSHEEDIDIGLFNAFFHQYGDAFLSLPSVPVSANTALFRSRPRRHNRHPRPNAFPSTLAANNSIAGIASVAVQ